MHFGTEMKLAWGDTGRGRAGALALLQSSQPFLRPVRLMPRGCSPCLWRWMGFVGIRVPSERDTVSGAWKEGGRNILLFCFVLSFPHTFFVCYVWGLVCNGQ